MIASASELRTLLATLPARIFEAQGIAQAPAGWREEYEKEVATQLQHMVMQEVVLSLSAAEQDELSGLSDTAFFEAVSKFADTNSAFLARIDARLMKFVETVAPAMFTAA